MTARIERAEQDSFLSLYRVAAATCGTGWHDDDGVQTVWSPHDDDPGYSCVMNLADAADPRAALARVEPVARSAGATVLGIDGSPALDKRLPERDLAELGFAGDYQECFWGRRIDPAERFDADDPRIARAGVEERDLFARVLNIGYDVPEDSVRGRVFASTIDLPGWFHYLVRYDGEPGSASVLYVVDGVAQLFVATTMPAYRGRGGQTALIKRRLADGQAAGCDLATSQTVIDNASPRNIARLGFQPLYTRWIYGKPLA
jgi:hypothetical protein